MKRWKQQLIVAAVLQMALGAIEPVLAVTPGDPSMKSATYSINESEAGGTGDYGSASANFKNLGGVDGGSTLGDIAVGNSSSNNYQINSGINTTAQPSLTFIVNTSSLNLGTLTTASMAKGIATFSVKDYTSYGYTVTANGSPLSYGGHQLAAMTTDTASSTGTEQFGMNMVRNTVAAIGSDPAQIPAGFGYGVAGDGVTGTYGSTRPYTISDKWRFNSGETVASAPKSSGETDYTATFIANIATVTPGGTYNGTITFICTGQF